MEKCASLRWRWSEWPGDGSGVMPTKLPRNTAVIPFMWQVIEMRKRKRQTQWGWTEYGRAIRESTDREKVRAKGGRQTEMSVPHVTSRGTKRESHPPPLWETLQEGNLRLRHQPQAPQVNMFFKLFISFSLSAFLCHFNAHMCKWELKIVCRTEAHTHAEQHQTACGHVAESSWQTCLRGE